MPEPIDPSDINWDKEFANIERERHDPHGVDSANLVWTEGSPVPESRPCPSCRREISPRARLCPHCRRRVKPLAGTPEAREDEDREKEKAQQGVLGCRGVIVAGIMLVGTCAGEGADGSKSQFEPAPERTRAREYWDPNHPNPPADKVRLEHLDEYAEWKDRQGR